MAIGTKDILIQVKGDNKDFNAAMMSSGAAMRTFGATTAATTGAAATGLTALTGAVIGQTAIVTASTITQAAAITVSQSKIRKESGLTVDEVRDLSTAMKDASDDVEEQTRIWDKYAHKAEGATDELEDLNKEVSKTKTITDKYRRVQDKLNKSLGTAKSKMAAFGELVQKHTKLLAVAGAAILGASVAVGKLVGKSIEHAKILEKVNAQTGIAIDDLSAYGYAAGQFAVEFDDLTEAIKDLNDRVYDAHEGNKDLIDTFDKLDVSIYNINGELKDSKTIFEEVGRAIGKIEDPAEKTNVAMQLMADNGYKMIPIFNDMNEFIEDTDFAKMQDMVMTEEDVKRLGEVDEQYNTLKTTIGAVGHELSMDLLPAVESTLEMFQWGAEHVLPGVTRCLQLLSVPLRIIIDSFRILALGAELAWEAVTGDMKEYTKIHGEIKDVVRDQLRDNANALRNRDRETSAIKEAGAALKSNSDIQSEINSKVKDARYTEAQRREDAWLASGGTYDYESLPKLFETTTTELSAAQVQAINMNITTGDIVNQGDVEELVTEIQDAMSGTRSGI